MPVNKIILENYREAVEAKFKLDKECKEYDEKRRQLEKEIALIEKTILDPRPFPHDPQDGH